MALMNTRNLAHDIGVKLGPCMCSHNSWHGRQYVLLGNCMCVFLKTTAHPQYEYVYIWESIHVFIAIYFTIYAAPLTVDLIGGNGSLVGSGNISLTLWVSISHRVPPCMYANVCVSVYACIHVCVFMHVYIRVCVHACIHTCVCVCVHACIHTCVCVCVHACIHTCVCVCLCSCMHVYKYVCASAHLYKSESMSRHLAPTWGSRSLPQTPNQ